MTATVSEVPAYRVGDPVTYDGRDARVTKVHRHGIISIEVAGWMGIMLAATNSKLGRRAARGADVSTT